MIVKERGDLRNGEAENELRSSQKFLRWAPPLRKMRPDVNHLMLLREKHYTVPELAKLWGVSRETIRCLFRDEPGVIKLNRPETRLKRGYVTLRIPESVALSIHQKIAA